MQSKQQLKPSQDPGDSGKVHKIFFTNPETEPSRECKSEGHTLKDCPSFLSMGIRDRCSEVKRLRLCLKCLTGNHSYRQCRVRCTNCRKGHNFLLHFNNSDNQQPMSQTTEQTTVNATMQSLVQLSLTLLMKWEIVFLFMRYWTVARPLILSQKGLLDLLMLVLKSAILR